MKTLFCTALLALVGCASAPSEFHGYTEKQDQFRPNEVSYFSDNIIIKPMDMGLIIDTTSILFNLHCTKTEATKDWYIKTVYQSSDWLFVQTLRFSVDGKLYVFRSQPSPKREVGMGLGEVVVTETNIFNLSEDFMASLWGAKAVIVRLEGQDYYKDKTLSERDIYDMNWFFKYVNTGGAK